MVKFALGYYMRDSGDGDIVYYYMNGEAPNGQFVLRDGAWIPLPGDGFGLADRLIDGDPEYEGPVTRPAGVPQFKA